MKGRISRTYICSCGQCGRIKDIPDTESNRSKYMRDMRWVNDPNNGWICAGCRIGRAARPPCKECGSETGHWMSCSEYTKHY